MIIFFKLKCYLGSDDFNSGVGVCRPNLCPYILVDEFAGSEDFHGRTSRGISDASLVPRIEYVTGHEGRHISAQEANGEAGYAGVDVDSVNRSTYDTDVKSTTDELTQHSVDNEEEIREEVHVAVNV